MSINLCMCMNKRAFWNILLTYSILLSSCGTVGDKSVAIRDFAPSLQPYLTQAISTGIVGPDSSSIFIEDHATDDQLAKLSHAEHPILRALALREMLRRRTFDHFDLVMKHLDDTAIVATDGGEFGIWFRTVSDYILENAKWKTIAARDSTMDEVLLNHDYLRSAYTGLHNLKLKEKYYSRIKGMAVRERVFDEREDALYALAEFKRREDLPVIKTILLSNCWRMQRRSFELMKDFPDTSYIEVLKKYYKSHFYRSICEHNLSSPAVTFIETISSYKSDSSAKILRAMIDRKPFIPCAADTIYLRSELIHAIWDNPCAAYAKIIEQTRKEREELKKSELEIDLPPAAMQHDKDTAAEPVNWWSFEK
jgi:hypothetical protein